MTEITVEKVRELDAARTQGDMSRAEKIGLYVLDFAKKLGWDDDGEGAFEFIQRTSYAQGVEDGTNTDAVTHLQEELTAANALVDRLEYALQKETKFLDLEGYKQVLLAEIQQFKQGGK